MELGHWSEAFFQLSIDRDHADGPRKADCDILRSANVNLFPQRHSQGPRAQLLSWSPTIITAGQPTRLESMSPPIPASDQTAMDTPDQPPSLPQELIDYILELVVEEWHSIPQTKRKHHEAGMAVARCMQGSRAFLTSVRRHLFAHVNTHERSESPASLESRGNEDVRRMKELWKLLKADPLRDSCPLASHIRSIKIEMDPLINKDPEELRPDTNHRWLKSDSSRMNWNARRMTMREVLRTLPNLNAFALQFTSPLSGHAFHVGLTLAVERLCESPLLTSLHFENMYHFPVDMLANCINLRHLRLVNIHVGDPDDFLVPLRPSYSSTLLGATWNERSLRHLEGLDTELSGDILEYIIRKEPRKQKAVSPAYFSILKTFKLSIHAQSGPSSLREVDVMSRAARTLKKLCISGIGFDVSCPRFPGRISLGEFEVLHTLHLKIAPLSLSLFRQMPRGLDPFLGIQVGPSTSLKTIVFDFTTIPILHLHDFSKLGVAQSDIDPLWAIIDNHLVDSQLYPSLSLVRFKLRFHYLMPFGSLGPGEGKDVGVKTLVEAADRIFPKVALSERIKYDADVDLVESRN